ncbi:MAG: RNA 2',3'-cyclic phosphodiesterase [Syntrophomonadaceae bacterium]|jgi:2'-5' RNA ligase
MRIFIAVTLAEPVREHLLRVRNRLRTASPDVKWVEYENFHLTLKFLGNIKPGLIPKIKEQLYTVGETCPTFELFPDQLGFFPSKIRPRVIWLGLKGEVAKAQFLGERVDAYLSELGFEPEKNRSMHLTIGRIRSELNLKEMLQVAFSEDFSSQVPIKVADFSLMESEISSRGPRYRVIERFELSG